MVDHRLILLDWIRSLTNVSKRFWPMPLYPVRSFWTFSGTTTFATKSKSLLLSWVKGFVKLSNVLLFARKQWDRQGMMVGIFCRRCPSYLFRFFCQACKFRSDDEKPCAGVWIQSDTFMDRLICWRAWLAPSAQNVKSSFLLTTQLLSSCSCVSARYIETDDSGII